MIKIINWFSLVTCVVVLSMGANCAPTFKISELAGEYLSMPHQEVTVDMDYLDSIQKVLAGVSLGNATEPEAVLEGFKALKAHLDLKSTDRSPLADAMIKDFIDLAHVDEPCREHLSLWFLGRFQEIEVSKLLRRPHALMGYMKHYGSKKFHNCALIAKSELKSRLANHEEDMKKLILFFQTVFFAQNSTDEELYIGLKEIDATSVKWNVDRTALLTLSISSDNKPKAAIENELDLQFENICAKLNKNFRSPLDFINLAATLNVGFDYFENDLTLKKLNEVNRICFQRDHRPWEYRENLRNHLGIFPGEASSSGSDWAKVPAKSSNKRTN